MELYENMNLGGEETTLNIEECTDQTTIVINTIFMENACPVFFPYKLVVDINSAAARLNSKITI